MRVIQIMDVKKMKVLVSYISNSGNTKKVAEAIYEEISAEKEIRSFYEVKNLDGYDLVFLGFPVQYHGKKIEILLSEITRGKNIALFITHALPEDNKILSRYLTECEDAVIDANLVGLFHCQGQLSGTLKFILKMLIGTRIRKLALEDTSQGQPDVVRLNKARSFAREMMEEVIQKNVSNIDLSEVVSAEKKEVYA